MVVHWYTLNMHIYNNKHSTSVSDIYLANTFYDLFPHIDMSPTNFLYEIWDEPILDRLNLGANLPI